MLLEELLESKLYLNVTLEFFSSDNLPCSRLKPVLYSFACDVVRSTLSSNKVNGYKLSSESCDSELCR